MTTSAVVFLGVAALGSFIQAVALILLGLELRRSFARVDALGQRVGGELRPALENLTRATAHVAQASEVCVVQARRLDGLLEDVADTVGHTGHLLERVVVPQARRLVTVATAVKTVRKGFALYQRWKRR
jgi:hypothetical protein